MRTVSTGGNCTSICLEIVWPELVVNGNQMVVVLKKSAEKKIQSVVYICIGYMQLSKSKHVIIICVNRRNLYQHSIIDFVLKKTC